MLVSFEGLSKTGKTTVFKEIKQRHPEWVELVGPRMTDVGVNNWSEYQNWEHAIKKRILDANPQTMFIANRFFSEAAYTHLADQRNMLMRMYGAYDDACMIYFYATKDELRERESHDMWRCDEIIENYMSLAQCIPTYEVNTSSMDRKTSVERVEEYLNSYR